MMPGAVLAAVSWAILSALFRLYVANFGNYNKAYGAIGAVIVLMLWLYMSAAVLLVGDQLMSLWECHVFTQQAGLKLHQSPESETERFDIQYSCFVNESRGNS
jgi:uncharacterized BrkB/YihY/UPF0761 family membrane protein